MKNLKINHLASKELSKREIKTICGGNDGCITIVCPNTEGSSKVSYVSKAYVPDTIIRDTIAVGVPFKKP